MSASPPAGEPGILIAGWSGRLLAQSARRAGYIPLVADAYGDEDTLALAGAHVRLPGARRGFRTAPLLVALSTLSAEAATPPVGLILGSGFEDRPHVVTELADHYHLLGCGAATVARCKDPAQFYPLLASLGIAHPETRLFPPTDSTGWLTRRVGGTGGTHIAKARADRRLRPHHYFQREAPGIAISVAGVVGAKGLALGFCRQWANPARAHPYRFGGIVGPVVLDADVEARLIDCVLPLVRALDLKGYVSFDFLVTPTESLLLEVNPRPGASLECLDDDGGSLFKAHVAAASGERVTVSPQRRDGARAVAYLYADRGALRVSDIGLPPHTADRPMPGTRLPKAAPVATVFADGASPEAAQALCRQRLEALEELLYQPAEHHQKTAL